MSSKPLAAIIPALPGWRAIVIQHDAEGKPVAVPNEPDKRVVEVIEVVAWGLLVPEGGFIMGFFGGGDPGAGMTPLAESSAEAERLDTRKGFIGYAYPGETLEQAIERRDRPQKEAEARAAARYPGASTPR